MKRRHVRLPLLICLLLAGGRSASGQQADAPLAGQAAYGDWHGDAPGVQRHLVPGDMPRPYASRSASNTPSIGDPPAGARPAAPAGYAVQLFARLGAPRLLRVAPNGDIFVAETSLGTIHVLRAADGAEKADRDVQFAGGLGGPFGIAFYPPGPDPRWVYVATGNAVVRFPYRSGDLVARGAPQTVVAALAGTVGYHTTRDIQFGPDGRRMYVSVGSGSNAGEDMGTRSPARAAAWQATHAIGAAWGDETDRADVLSFDPEGGDRRVFATGIRNCVGLAVHPATGTLWCATNERDGLGDNLVPDYVTQVREGGFYGWPWFYVGANQDPRRAGERPDLAARVTVPDVLLQPHSAPLQMSFYPANAGAAAFPREMVGDGFVALHGSWNRSRRTGYKVVRVRLRNGVPTGVYEDFLTGLVTNDDTVWGRPVGVAVAHDGALLVTEDANGAVWRVAHVGRRHPPGD